MFGARSPNYRHDTLDSRYITGYEDSQHTPAVIRVSGCRSARGSRQRLTGGGNFSSREFSIHAASDSTMKRCTRYQGHLPSIFARELTMFLRLIPFRVVAGSLRVPAADEASSPLDQVVGNRIKLVGIGESALNDTAPGRILLLDDDKSASTCRNVVLSPYTSRSPPPESQAQGRDTPRLTSTEHRARDRVRSTVTKLQT